MKEPDATDPFEGEPITLERGESVGLVRACPGCAGKVRAVVFFFHDGKCDTHVFHDPPPACHWFNTLDKANLLSEIDLFVGPHSEGGGCVGH